MARGHPLSKLTLVSTAVPSTKQSDQLSNGWISLERWRCTNRFRGLRRLLSATSLTYELRGATSVITLTAGSHFARLGGLAEAVARALVPTNSLVEQPATDSIGVDTLGGVPGASRLTTLAFGMPVAPAVSATKFTVVSRLAAVLRIEATNNRERNSCLASKRLFSRGGLGNCNAGTK
jgi:hypothetical protein